MDRAPNFIEYSRYDVAFNNSKSDYEKGGFHLEDAMRLGFYCAIIAIFVMIIALVVKLMWNCDGEEVGDGEYIRPNDTSRLLVPKEEVMYISYGTTSDEDLESGEGSCRSTNSSSSSDDLYDEKICAICYDDPRSCLFVPCGHCITCYTCAKRIINDQINNSCPICRTIIHKVRKLQIFI